MKNKRDLKVLRIISYIVMGLLLLCSGVIAILCFLYNCIWQGAVISVAALVLMFILIELIRIERKDIKMADIDYGQVLVSIADVSLRLPNDVRDFGTMELCSEGIVVHGDKGLSAYLWDDVKQYIINNERIIRFVVNVDGNIDDMQVTCNSALKCKAAEHVLMQHVPTGFDSDFI